jgi:hypothetical protein
MTIVLQILAILDAHPELVDDGVLVVERLVALFDKHPVAAAKLTAISASHPNLVSGLVAHFMPAAA